MTSIIEPKPLPFKVGDEVEVYFPVHYIGKVYTITGRVVSMSGNTVRIRKSYGCEVDIARASIYLSMEEARRELLKLIYQRIEKALIDIENGTNQVEALVY